MANSFEEGNHFKELYDKKNESFDGSFFRYIFGNNQNVTFNGNYKKCLFHNIIRSHFAGNFIDCRAEGGISNSDFSGEFIHSRHLGSDKEITRKDISGFSDKFYIKEKSLESNKFLLCDGFEESLRERSEDVF